MAAIETPTVVIDPGHGGSTPSGGSSPSNPETYTPASGAHYEPGEVDASRASQGAVTSRTAFELVLHDFSPGDAALKPAHVAALQAFIQAHALTSAGPPARITSVRGYTDMGDTEARNLPLRNERRDTVVRWLNAAHVSVPDHPATQNPPSANLLADNGTRLGRSLNRSVVVEYEVAPPPPAPPPPAARPAGSTRWALRPLAKITGGDLVAGGIFSFRLTDRTTHQSHELWFVGVRAGTEKGAGSSGSISAGDEGTEFETDRPVNFEDFDRMIGGIVVAGAAAFLGVSVGFASIVSPPGASNPFRVTRATMDDLIWIGGIELGSLGAQAVALDGVWHTVPPTATAQALAGGNGNGHHGTRTVFDTPAGFRVHTRALSGSPVAAPTTIFLPAQGGGYEDFIQAQTKGDLMPLLNGRSWNPANDLTEPLDQMQTFVQSATSGDRVYLAAWYFEPQTQLTLGSYTSSSGQTADDWGRLFAAKAAEGVIVRILQTDFDAGFFKDSHDAIRDPWYAYLNGLIAGLPAGTQDNLKYVVSLHPAHTNLLRWVGGGTVNIASHHQKFMVVKLGQATTAFCGGLDIESRKTPRRWANPPTGARPLSGWHDIHVRLQGPIARDLEKEFALRWNREKDASGMTAQPGWSGYETLPVPTPPQPGEADAAPEKQLENVQMIRTVSVDGGWTSAYDTKRDDIGRVYRNIVASAESFLYFENQYFRSSDLAAALEAAAAANPNLVAIFVVVGSAGADDGANPVTRHGDYLEREFFRRVSTAFGGRAGFFTMPWRAVHSKFALGDDRVMTIGSANANDRSFRLDSELNVAIDDVALTSRFRKRLWAWNLGASEADVATWSLSDYLDRWRRIAASNKAAFDAAFDPVAHTVNVPAIEAIPGEGVLPFDWTTLPDDTSLPVPDVLATIDFDPSRDQAQTDGVPDTGDGTQTVAASLETEDEVIAAHPGTLYGVDVAGIGTGLLAHLPLEPEFVGRVFDKLLSSDRDDVAQAIAEQAPDATLAALGATTGGRTLVARMVTELQNGPTTPGELAQMERLIRLSSPMHARLKDEPWNSDPAVTGALSAVGASVQPITDGVGATIFDEYAVTIDSMPPGVTPETFLRELALDPNGAAHNPSFDSVNVFRRRASGGSPTTGDIYDIDIAGPDNGSVVLGELASDHFVFQTITTRFAETGSHPECGARAFGFDRNADGSFTFYTRGASRIAPAIAAAPGGETGGAAMQTRGWTQLMIGIAAAIQGRGGSARPSSFRMWNTRP